MSARIVCLSMLSVALAACSGSSNSPSPPPPPAVVAPTAVADSAQADNGAAMLIDVLANDNNGGGTLTLAEVGAPANGSAAISGGRIAYTPNAGFFGTDSFTYRISNSAGSSSATVTVSSAVAVELNGQVAFLREEPIEVRALGGGTGPVRQLAAGERNWSLRLRSENPDQSVLLQAQGGAAPGLPVAQRYLSLLPSMRELLERAGCDATGCRLGVTAEPRLVIGALTTAEYGLFDELVGPRLAAGAAQAKVDPDLSLLQPGLRDGLKGYIVAESLLQHAALVERAVRGEQRPADDYSAEDSLALVLSREELARVARPLGGEGSGGVANESALSEARRRLAFDSPWSDSAAMAEARLERASLTWLGAPAQARRFAAAQWRDGRLVSHGNREQQTGDEGDNFVFRRIDAAVSAAVEDGLLVLRPAPGVPFLAERAVCFFEACSVRTATSIAIAGFLGEYAMVIERGTQLGVEGEAPLHEEAVTLLQPLAISAGELAGPVYTALSTVVTPGDPRLSFYFNEVLNLSLLGSYAMDDALRFPLTPRSRQGSWQLDDEGVLRLADLNGTEERLWLAARGAGRGIAVLETVDADGGRRVAAVEWLPLGGPRDPLPAVAQQCLPQADGWQPAARAPALAPPVQGLQLGADGVAVRFNGSAPPAEPAEFDRFAWRAAPGRLEFSSLRDAPVASFQLWPLAEVNGLPLLHMTQLHPQRDTGDRFIARDQQFGGSVLFDCTVQ